MWKEGWISVCGLQFIRLRVWCCWFKHRCCFPKINTTPPHPPCIAQSSQHLRCRDQEGREMFLRSWVSEVWEPVREPAYWPWCGWCAPWSLEGNQSQISLLTGCEASLFLQSYWGYPFPPFSSFFNKLGCVSAGQLEPCSPSPHPSHCLPKFCEKVPMWVIWRWMTWLRPNGGHPPWAVLMVLGIVRPASVF